MEPLTSLLMKGATFLGVLLATATFMTLRFTPRGRLCGGALGLAGVGLMVLNAKLPHGLGLLADLAYLGVAAALLHDEMRRPASAIEARRLVEFHRVGTEP